MKLPEAFEYRTMTILGDEFPEFLDALNDNIPTSVRVNNKIEYEPSDKKVSWCKSGYYLDERPLFTADPLFHAGVYYVQEASSMFLEQVVRQHFPTAETVLDLCAAPGGKSTLLSQTLSQNSLLVSNEIVRSRAYILAENLIKWGNPNVVVSNNEPKDFARLSGYFDAVLIDAPCSGEGMFRKDAGAIEEWSEYNVKSCVERQRNIVSSVWDGLKEDGILVYSTCTFNREENEENVQWICKELGAEVLSVDLHGNNEITKSECGYRFYPHKTKGEGFFISVLRKTSVPNNLFKHKKADRYEEKPFVVDALELIQSEFWFITKENNYIKAYDKNRLIDFRLLNKYLKCMYSGVLLGEMKGNDFIPSANIALSKILNKSSVNSVELDYESAISFLRKDSILLSESKRGYVLVCYKGLGLGWVKNLGNRCNNLYPHEWRIRMKL